MTRSAGQQKDGTPPPEQPHDNAPANLTAEQQARKNAHRHFIKHMPLITHEQAEEMRKRPVKETVDTDDVIDWEKLRKKARVKEGE